MSSSSAAAPASESKSKSEIEIDPESWAARRVARETSLRRARAQLHLASVPERLLSRDVQRGVVADFCCGRLDARRGGALYVCGSPGLGKSLTVRAAMAQLKEESSPAVRFAFFNASLCFEPSAVYAALLHELGGGSGGAASSSTAGAKAKPAADPDAKALLEEMLAPAAAAGGAVADGAAGGGKRKRALSTAKHGAESKGGGAMCVVALDEIDQLLGRQQGVLYQLFDWAAVPTSPLEPWPWHWPWHWHWHWEWYWHFPFLTLCRTRALARTRRPTRGSCSSASPTPSTSPSASYRSLPRAAPRRSSFRSRHISPMSSSES